MESSNRTSLSWRTLRWDRNTGTWRSERELGKGRRGQKDKDSWSQLWEDGEFIKLLLGTELFPLREKVAPCTLSRSSRRFAAPSRTLGICFKNPIKTVEVKPYSYCPQQKPSQILRCTLSLWRKDNLMLNPVLKSFDGAASKTSLLHSRLWTGPTFRVCINHCPLQKEASLPKVESSLTN